VICLVFSLMQFFLCTKYLSPEEIRKIIDLTIKLHSAPFVIIGYCLCVGHVYRETALSLARDGMKVFLACRSVDKAHEAATYIREVLPCSLLVTNIHGQGGTSC
jgi:hypothetical protein